MSGRARVHSCFLFSGQSLKWLLPSCAQCGKFPYLWPNVSKNQVAEGCLRSPKLFKIGQIRPRIWIEKRPQKGENPTLCYGPGRRWWCDVVNGAKKGVQSGLVCDTIWMGTWVRSQLWPLGLPKNFYRFMTYLWPRSPSEMIWRTLWSAFWPALESWDARQLSKNETIFQLSEKEQKIF